ncbi:unnamed protein product [Scytosiphon promiscuus]
MSPKRRNRLRFDEESLWSITDQNTADEMSNIALLLPGVSVATAVIDGTACVGGNAISFVSAFDEVWAVEIDPDRFDLLKGNVKKSIARSAHKQKTVRFFNADFLDVLENERDQIAAKRPVVFIDPPWGGEEYKKKGLVDLVLSDTKMVEVCSRSAKAGARHVLLKVPTNFNVRGFRDAVGAAGRVTLHDLRKMLLIAVDYDLAPLSPSPPPSTSTSPPRSLGSPSPLPPRPLPSDGDGAAVAPPVDLPAAAAGGGDGDDGDGSNPAAAVTAATASAAKKTAANRAARAELLGFLHGNTAVGVGVEGATAEAPPPPPPPPPPPLQEEQQQQQHSSSSSSSSSSGINTSSGSSTSSGNSGIGISRPSRNIRISSSSTSTSTSTSTRAMLPPPAPPYQEQTQGRHSERRRSTRQKPTATAVVAVVVVAFRRTAWKGEMVPPIRRVGD